MGVIFKDNKVLFVDGKVAMSKACCCSASTCEACKDGKYPPTITASFAGIVAGTGPGGCPSSDCEVYANEDQILHPTTPPGCSVEGANNWYAYYYESTGDGTVICNHPGACNTHAAAGIHWNYNSVANRRAAIMDLSICHGNTVIRYKRIEDGATGPFSCTAFSGLTLSFSSHWPEPPKYCDGTNSTAQWTASSSS